MKCSISDIATASIPLFSQPRSRSERSEGVTLASMAKKLPLWFRAGIKYDTEARVTTLWLLRAIAAASLLVPLGLFAFASWISFHDTQALADERISRSLDVMEEEALKAFQSVNVAIDGIQRLLGARTAREITANEPRLHADLVAIKANCLKSNLFGCSDQMDDRLSSHASCRHPRCFMEIRTILQCLVTIRTSFTLGTSMRRSLEANRISRSIARGATRRQFRRSDRDVAAAKRLQPFSRGIFFEDRGTRERRGSCIRCSSAALIGIGASTAIGCSVDYTGAFPGFRNAVKSIPCWTASSCRRTCRENWTTSERPTRSSGRTAGLGCSCSRRSSSCIKMQLASVGPRRWRHWRSFSPLDSSLSCRLRPIRCGAGRISTAPSQ